MALELEKPVADGKGPLAQGSILQDVRYYIVQIDSGSESDDLNAQPIDTEFAVVTTPMCDLQQDFKARFPGACDGNGIMVDAEKYLLPSLLMCEAFSEKSFRNLPQINAPFFKKVRKNEHLRYHRLVFESGSSAPSHESIFLDFRRLILVPTADVYEGLHHGSGFDYLGILARPYRTQLIQRLFYYYSRIDVPDRSSDVPYSE